jgi:hypothetical protein
MEGGKMSSGEEKMWSAENVRQLSTEELCKWLEDHPGLHPSHKGMAIEVVKKQSILGTSFLRCPEAKWEMFGLPWGVADALFQLAQRALEIEQKTSKC